MEHTATPWHVSGTEKNLHIGSMGSPMVLASMNDIHVDTPANAAFIVRACNAHDDLVKALYSCINCIETALGNCAEVEQAYAALKKAGQ